MRKSSSYFDGHVGVRPEFQEAEMPLLEIKDPDVTDDAYRFYLITRTNPLL